MLSADAIILQATRRLAAGNPDWENYELDLAALLPSALGKLGDDICKDEARRGLLMQTYSVSLNGSGVGDFLAATGSLTSTADIISWGIYHGTVIDAEGNILQPIKNYASFLRPQPQVYDYYCLANERIYTRSKTQQVNLPTDVVSVAGPLTITANFSPSVVAHVPDELDTDLINNVCFFALQKLEGMRPLKQS